MSHLKSRRPVPLRGARDLGRLAVLVAAAAATSAVWAQYAPDDQSSAGAKFTLGSVAASAPRYEGADHYRLRALPFVNYRDGRFFAGALTGIGFAFTPTADLQIGPVLSYRFGRDENDDDRFRGLGDIDAGVDAGVFVRWNLRPWFVHATLKQGIGGNVTGTQFNVGAGYVLGLSPRDRVVFDTAVDWADEDVMQGIFGVTDAQSLRSGLPTYRADAGVRRLGVGALWTHAFTAQWFSSVGVAAYRLGHQAADSPITVDRNGAAVTVGAGYRF
jgi:outer membrane scaffolding protein for murein synthesis (MipA/OmpV family)